MMVVSDNVNHDCSSIIKASSMVIFGNSLLESLTLIYLWITLARYLAFIDRITPWSIGCFREVVFEDKKMRSMAVNLGKYGCAGQLSTINSILRFWSDCFIQSVKISESIQLFVCALYIYGTDFIYLIHFGFSNDK